MDIRRFGAQYRSRGYTLARTTEDYATYYDIHYPNEERLAGRPLRLSPAYEELAALDAVFGEKSAGSGRTGSRPTRRPATKRLRPRGWAGQHWSRRSARRCNRKTSALRENLILR